jgi:hypothetical protein
VYSQGETRSGIALSLLIGPNASFGAYRGQFTIIYDGVPPGGQIVAQDFTVNVIPEPTTLVLLGTGLVGAAGVGFRKRRRDRTD